MLKWFRNKTILALVVEVNMNEVLEFINEKMKVLLILREYQVEIDGVKLCPLNQQEIANNVPCGKLKANQLINELIDSGYIEMMRSKEDILLQRKDMRYLRKCHCKLKCFMKVLWRRLYGRQQVFGLMKPLSYLIQWKRRILLLLLPKNKRRNYF